VYTPEQAQARRARERANPALMARRAEKQRRRVAEIQAYLNTYKVERGCVDCGYNANPLALQFDHVRGKNRDVSRCRTLTTAKAEIELCEVRCANCHHIKTHERRMSGEGLLGGRPSVDGAVGSEVALRLF
jgi:hypothetical protein